MLPLRTDFFVSESSPAPHGVVTRVKRSRTTRVNERSDRAQRQHVAHRALELVELLARDRDLGLHPPRRCRARPPSPSRTSPRRARARRRTWSPRASTSTRPDERRQRVVAEHLGDRDEPADDGIVELVQPGERGGAVLERHRGAELRAHQARADVVVRPRVHRAGVRRGRPALSVQRTAVTSCGGEVVLGREVDRDLHRALRDRADRIRLVGDVEQPPALAELPAARVARSSPANARANPAAALVPVRRALEAAGGEVGGDDAVARRPCRGGCGTRSCRRSTSG